MDEILEVWEQYIWLKEKGLTLEEIVFLTTCGTDVWDNLAVITSSADQLKE